MFRDRSGMALVLTLLAVSFLVAVTLQLFSSVNRQMQAAHNLQEAVRLDAMTFSGLNLARAALLADQRENQFDSLHDSWNALDAEAVSALFDQGRVEVSVTDLSGRLQVNALVSREKDAAKRRRQEKRQHDMWYRLLTSGRFAIESEDEAVALIDALKDWIDQDNAERDHGAENDYYQALDNPYSARNGPAEYPEELLLVRGMSKQLFYGDPKHVGLVDYVTTAGLDGKININTAPIEVLQVLSEGISKEIAQELIDFRGEKRNIDFLSRSDWVRRVSGFPGDLELDQDLLTVVSHDFLVTVTAKGSGMVKTGIGLVHRDDKQTQKLLYWKVE